jgi:hypothetical protein
MRSIITTGCILISLASSGQESASNSQFLTSVRKTHGVFIELSRDAGTVFTMGYMIDKAGTGYVLDSVYTITPQPGTSSYYYADQRPALESKEGRQYVSFPGYKSKIKHSEVKTVDDLKDLNYKLNNGYWWKQFLKLSNEMNARYKWFHYTFRAGFPLWKSFTNQDIYYRDFMVFADNKIKILRDSIIKAQLISSGTTEFLITNIPTIEYTVLKDSLFTLPDAYDHKYFGQVVNEICLKRPELFFRLADDIPDKRSALFGVFIDKEARRKLKQVQTDSPSKKFYFKHY